MLDATLKAQLQGYLERLVDPVELVLATDDGESSRQLRALADDIAALSRKITVRNDTSAARIPSFAIARVGESPRVRFAGLPLGHEFSSLVLALLQVSGHPPRIEPAVAEQIRALPAGLVDVALNFPIGFLTGLWLGWDPRAALLLGGHRSKPVRILACALLGSLAIALVGSTKAGAGPSYYITVVCILALMTVAALVEVPANLRFPLVVALGLATLVAAVPSRETLSAWKHSVRFDSPPGVEVASAVLAQMPPGPLWSENGRLACSTSRPVIADDAHSLHRAVLSGRMSMEPVLRTLREHRAAVQHRGSSQNCHWH